MDKSRILILDCKGTSKPAVCFTLEVAGYSTYVVRDENEAINLLSNARSIERKFSCLVVNDYSLERDPANILESIHRSGVCESGCTIVFSSHRDVAQDTFLPLAEKYPQLKIYACHSGQVAGFVSALQERV